MHGHIVVCLSVVEMQPFNFIITQLKRVLISSMHIQAIYVCAHYARSGSHIRTPTYTHVMLLYTALYTGGDIAQSLIRRGDCSIPYTEGGLLNPLYGGGIAQSLIRRGDCSIPYITIHIKCARMHDHNFIIG